MRNRTIKDYGRFVEAAIALSFAKLMVALAPFRILTDLAGWQGIRSPLAPDADGLAQSVVLAVRRASRKLPIRCVCIHEGLATQLMLRRRGMASLFHYGVRQHENRLSAHVWVTLNGNILIGEAEAGHARVASYPDRDG